MVDINIMMKNVSKNIQNDLKNSNETFEKEIFENISMESYELSLEEIDPDVVEVVKNNNPDLEGDMVMCHDGCDSEGNLLVVITTLDYNDNSGKILYYRYSKYNN